MVLPMVDVVIGCADWTTGGTIAVAEAGGTLTGEIPVATGLLGNEGGAGFGGGPLVAGEKFAPKIHNYIFKNNLIKELL